jgi:hypothetical protein
LRKSVLASAVVTAAVAAGTVLAATASQAAVPSAAKFGNGKGRLTLHVLSLVPRGGGA